MIMNNRVYKFRAWDKDDKCFIRKVQEDRMPTQNTREGFRLDTRFKLSQYAGFKDKFDKPVYEGDILQWCYGNGDKSMFVAAVVFGHYSSGRDSWGLENTTIGFFLQFADNGVCGIDRKIKMYEIIGNIYEHPHLLSGDVVTK
jgi:hypothetical protein